MNRSRIALVNMFSSLMNKLVTISIAVILPRLMIVNLGSEVNGLTTSITNMFVYINLLEAGIGGASTYALYSRIVKKDKSGVNGILAATNRYYKSIGIYFFGIVSALAFIYPSVVESELSYLTIFSVVILSAIPTVLNYFLHGKYSILLSADNRGYVKTNLNTFTTFILCILKIVLLVKGFNIIVIQLASILVSVMYAMSIICYVKRNYKWIDLSSVPDYKAINKKNSVLVHQISKVVFANSDVLILTFFADLNTVSIYTVYSMIFTQVYAIPQFITDGVTASFGQIYNENIKRFKWLFTCFEIFYLQIVYASFTTALLLTLPFVKLYTAGITDVNYIDNMIPCLFTIAYVFLSIEIPYILLIQISGHFKQTQLQAVLGTTINIVVSLIFVSFYGISGVLIGTIVSVLYRCLVTIRYCNKNIIKRNITNNAIDGVVSVMLCCFIAWIYYGMINSIESYFQFLLVTTFFYLTLLIILIGKTIILRKKDSQTLFLYVKNIIKGNK